jgi:hypothetical protein
MIYSAYKIKIICEPTGCGKSIAKGKDAPSLSVDFILVAFENRKVISYVR